MAAFLGSPALLSPTLTRLNFSTHSQQPPPHLPRDPSSPPPQQQQLLSSTGKPPSISPQEEPEPGPRPKAPRASPAPESTDWIASSLTRRFGLGAGLAWVGFLAAGVVSEQVKTRFEAFQQQADTRDVEKEEEVLLPNGIRYFEMRSGGGSSPRQGDLIVIDLLGKVEGADEAFVDTFGEGKRPLALVMGSRPYTKGMCEGVEYVLRRLMKAGGKARILVPPSLGFGDHGADFGPGALVPPSAPLEFVVQVDRVSIALA